MKRLPIWVKPLLSASSFVFALLLWINFSPREAGGQASYIIIIGQSMEPDYHVNDMVITHRAAVYAVGDAVAYRHPRLGIIYHRIVEVDGDVFIVQGDNNPWLDSYTPTEADILGKEWLHLPGAGRILRVFRSPGMFALLVGGLVGGIYYSSKYADRRSKKKNKGIKVSSGNEKFLETLFSLAILGLVALFLAIVSFSQPLNLLVEDSISVQMNGRFEYAAKAVQGVYDQPDAQTGDPIFRRVSDSMEISFSYQIQNVVDASGVYRLLLVIGDETGWSRTIVLQEETTFEGTEFTTEGVIDFAAVSNLIQEFESKTGVQRSRYLMTVQPVVQTSVIQDVFSPELTFFFDDVQVIAIADGDGPYFPSEIYSLSFTKEVPKTISVFGMNIKVLNMRILSAVALVLLTISAGWFFWSESRIKHAGLAAEIKHVYGERLVSVEKAPAKRGATVVSDFSDLLRLADQQGVNILHAQKDGVHIYFAQLAEGIYYFELEDIADVAEDPIVDASLLESDEEKDG